MDEQPIDDETEREGFFITIDQLDVLERILDATAQLVAGCGQITSEIERLIASIHDSNPDLSLLEEPGEE